MPSTSSRPSLPKVAGAPGFFRASSAFCVEVQRGVPVCREAGLFFVRVLFGHVLECHRTGIIKLTQG